VGQVAEERRNWLKAGRHERIRASKSLDIIYKVTERFASLTLIDNIKL
jgi:hypothetical protein